MRPRPQIMTLTPAAVSRVKELTAKAEQPKIGVRVGVDKGGCAGMSYKIELADGLNPGDELVEAEGAKVIVDSKAVLYLLGTRMDFETTKFRSGFVFQNPNQTSACGCGESVALSPASISAL